MTTTHTTTPTAAQRFAAHAAKRDAERDGNFTLARALRAAAYADGFPHSYTAEAVRVGRALIVAIADEDDTNAAMLVLAMSDMLAGERVLA